MCHFKILIMYHCISNTRGQSIFVGGRRNYVKKIPKYRFSSRPTHSFEKNNCSIIRKLEACNDLTIIYFFQNVSSCALLKIFSGHVSLKRIFHRNQLCNIQIRLKTIFEIRPLVRYDLLSSVVFLRYDLHSLTYYCM